MHLRGLVARGTNQMIRGLELPVPRPLMSTLEEKGWKLTQLSMANDLINHAYK